MASNAKYALWLQKAVEDSDLIEELKRISGDEKEIYDRFYKELEFGTAGLRGGNRRGHQSYEYLYRPPHYPRPG